jgi:undecaprenyl-phosphate galactose phosphotransferase
LFKFLLYALLLSASLVISIEISHLYFIKDATNHPFSKYLWLIFIYLFWVLFFKLANNRMVTIKETILLFKSNLLALFTIMAIVSIIKEAESYSRLIILLYCVLNMFILPFASFFVKRYFLLRFGFLRENIFAIVDDKGASQIQAWFNKDNAFGFDITQTLNISKVSKEELIARIDEMIGKEEFFAVVIAVDDTFSKRLFYLIDHIQRRINKVIVLPKISSNPFFNAEIINSINHKGLAFFIRNNLLNKNEQLVKRVTDYLLALFFLLLFSPLLAGLYLFILFSNKSNPIFKHKRIGKGGKAFYIYKFKSMYDNADEILQNLLQSDAHVRAEWEREFKLKNDPRITKVGKFLRKTSLDELPQFFNVLKGDMSIVGPRPIINDEIAKYGEYFDYFKAVKPGITGLWQVSGRNDVSYAERVQLDVWYVRNWSVELDFLVLLKTVIITLNQKGSY